MPQVGLIVLRDRVVVQEADSIFLRFGLKIIEDSSRRVVVDGIIPSSETDRVLGIGKWIGGRMRGQR